MESRATGKARPYLAPLMLAGVFVAAWILLKTNPDLSRVVFLGFFAVVLAALFDIPTTFFARAMPRPLAVFLTFLLLVGLLAGTLLLAVPLFIEQARHITERAPAAVERIEAWWRSHASGGLLGTAQHPSQLRDGLRVKLGALAAGVVPAAMGTVAFVSEAAVAAVLGLFLVYHPETYVRGLIALFPKDRETTVTEVTDAMGRVLRGWIWGTLISMGLIGFITGMGLLCVGVEGWFALAVLAFFGAFIPFLGPVITAVPGVAVGLAESPRKALLALIVYFATYQLEGHLIRPLVMRKTVRIQPAVLILWQLAFSIAFGLWGLLVATPLLAVVQTAIRVGYLKKTLYRED